MSSSFQQGGAGDALAGCCKPRDVMPSSETHAEVFEESTADLMELPSKEAPSRFASVYESAPTVANCKIPGYCVHATHTEPETLVRLEEPVMSRMEIQTVAGAITSESCLRSRLRGTTEGIPSECLWQPYRPGRASQLPRFQKLT